ncbi:MAG: hypothetical protein FWB90_05970 [Fibromonadales bacterium]|nr:hypothetical protein [Fibromonadales bacterium]
MNKLYIAVFAMLALMSCSDNLFGSSGGGNCGDDIQCLRIEAQNAFRNGKYEDSHKAYAKIVKLDSTASIGYFGMAKAGLWMKGINPFDIFRFINIDDDQIPFIGEEIIVQNRYLQGMRTASEPLSILERRDSLTALWELHMENNPSLASRLDTFRLVFCGGSPTGTCYDTTAKRPKFPLSDREYKYNTYYGGLLISTMAKSLLDFFDINKDGCITRRGIKGSDNPGDPSKDSTEWKRWGCNRGRNGEFSHDWTINLVKNADGSFTIDTDLLMEEMLHDLEEFFEEQINNPNAELPAAIQDINVKIDEFTGSLDEVINILGSVGLGNLIEDGCEVGGDYADENCGNGLDSIPSDPNAWQDEISKYKDFASFYKMGTRIDEDGDGCVDEEMLNKQDNDGDGIKGENSRLASTDQDSPFYGRAGTNHSMYGDPEGMADINNARNLPRVLPTLAPHYICNNPKCTIQTELWGDEEGYVTVIGFTQEPGYWTTSDLDIKLKVAQDTICPPKYDLKFRQDSVGGCWKNYDNDKFATYWLKRKLAREPGRVHSSCLKCEGIACLKD